MGGLTGKNKKNSTPQPDYNAMANATAAANQAAADRATIVNRPDQKNPWGNLDYTQNADGTWTATETLNPNSQAALDSQQAIQAGLSGTAQGLLGQVASNYSQPFNAASWDSYRQNLSNVNTQKLGTAGTFSTNSNVNQSVIDPSGVNVNAPQFDPSRQDQYSKAAYNAQMALLQGDMDAQLQKTQDRLALQGLAPNAEASTGAMSSLYDAQSRARNQAAAQAVLTGNTMSNNDYGSQLAGFKAGNEAVGQNFSQNLASQQAYNNTQQQLLNRDKDVYSTNLAGLTTNAALQGAENQAQNQAFNQNLQTYGTNWQEELSKRNMPLTEIQSLLGVSGSVQNPTYENFYQSPYTGGADYLNAGQLQNQYYTNIANQNAAQSSSNMNALGGLVGGIFGAAGQAGGFSNLFSGFSDERLKDNIQPIGQTPGGSTVYEWDWNAKAHQVGADKQPNIGVIAQENPHAAFRTNPRGPGRGFLMVDYSKIQ